MYVIDLPKPPSLELRMGAPIKAFDTRSGREHYMEPLIGHVVAVLEAQCPICGGKLEVARRVLFGEGRRVGRCDNCWLDFCAQQQTTADNRASWTLIVAERCDASPKKGGV